MTSILNTNVFVYFCRYYNIHHLFYVCTGRSTDKLMRTLSYKLQIACQNHKLILFQAVRNWKDFLGMNLTYISNIAYIYFRYWRYKVIDGGDIFLYLCFKLCRMLFAQKNTKQKAIYANKNKTSFERIVCNSKSSSVASSQGRS